MSDPSPPESSAAAPDTARTFWPRRARARLALVDAEGAVLLATEGALRGARGEAKHLADLLGATPEEVPELDEALARVREGGEREVELAGGALGVRLSAQEGDGAPILVEIEDRSDVVRARAMRDALLASLERMGRQTSVLAHEIKNPVTALHLALRAVAGSLGEEPSEVLEDFVRRLKRIERSLRRSLGYALPIGLSRGVVPVERLVGAVTETVAGEARAAEVAIDVAIEPGAPPVYGDDERLAEALAAIVRNALEEPDVGRVRIAATSDSGDVVLKVEDDGPGVPPYIRAILFEPFVSTRPESAGMGLAEATKIVEAHGGRLELAEGELGGACFLLYLPSAPDADASAPSDSPTPQPEDAR